MEQISHLERVVNTPLVLQPPLTSLFQVGDRVHITIDLRNEKGTNVTKTHQNGNFIILKDSNN